MLCCVPLCVLSAVPHTPPSAHHLHTHSHRRNNQGFAANFVETEQLVTLDDGHVVASYVQVRGAYVVCGV